LGDRTLLANFTSLSAYQLTNFIIPLLVYPYILRVIGVEKFGLVAWAQAIIAYLVIFNDYGFNLTVTREVSLIRNDLKAVSVTFTRTTAARFLLALWGFLFLLILVFAIPLFRHHALLLIWSYTIVVGQLLLPLWLFQGLERMQYLTWLNLAAKLSYALLIFLFIQSPEDYLMVNVWFGVGSFIAGMISLGIILFKLGINVQFREIQHALDPIKNSTSIFISNLTGFVSTNSYLIVLAFFVDAMALGYYSIAEKIFIAMRAMAVILHQAVYPKVCLLAQDSVEAVRAFFRSFTRITLLLLIPVCLLVYLLSDYIIYFLLVVGIILTHLLFYG